MNATTRLSQPTGSDTVRVQRASVPLAGSSKWNCRRDARQHVATARAKLHPYHHPSRTDSRRSGFTLIELLVVIAIIGVLVAMLMPALSRAKGRAKNAVCLSQLRQLGIATRLYSDENNNRMPAAELLPSLPIDPAKPLPRIRDVLGAAIGQSAGTNSGANVFQCPQDKLGLFEKEGSSYEWNTDLNGRRMDETRTSNVRIIKVVVIDGQPVEQSDERKELRFPPATTPLLLDYEDFHPRPPRPGKNVVYMDGHATGFELPPAIAAP